MPSHPRENMDFQRELGVLGIQHSIINHSSTSNQPIKGSSRGIPKTSPISRPPHLWYLAAWFHSMSFVVLATPLLLPTQTFFWILDSFASSKLLPQRCVVLVAIHRYSHIILESGVFTITYNHCSPSFILISGFLEATLKLENISILNLEEKT